MSVFPPPVYKKKTTQRRFKRAGEGLGGRVASPVKLRTSRGRLTKAAFNISKLTLTAAMGSKMRSAYNNGYYNLFTEEDVVVDLHYFMAISWKEGGAGNNKPVCRYR